MTLAQERALNLSRPYWRRMHDNAIGGLARLFIPPRPTAAPPAWRAPSLMAAWTAIIVVAVAASMVLIDAAAVVAARELPLPVLSAFGRISAYGKSSWLLWPVGSALVAVLLVGSLALPKLTRTVLAAVAVRLGYLFLAIGVPGLVVAIGKRIIGRGRPYATESVDPFTYLQFVWRADYASLPSGHATTAFAALVAVGVLWPRLLPLMWIYAVAVAASRVAVGAHFPSDIIAGAAIGAAGALLVRDWFATRGLGFTLDARGAIRPKPGPSLARLSRMVAGRRRNPQ